MHHDRIHARKPTHDLERWSTGTIESIDERDGHCVVTVLAADGETVELTVTFAIRELVLSRLDIDDGASPTGERVWYRKRGG
ncbi:hypothetical protein CHINAEXTREME_11855 [Halobiforma lacisalsi AJ5]|uniref:Uncharacterized protein n=1 Tax=Natronobacterium lacisalsi AJ5 TaxID=358396 RepID=M0LFB9_NATLA|nr:hypothetical protein [Halobiforma lacisalsi]APW98434.1 hypothetical protein CHINAEXTREME_11855 [Halobiforma lacisalsi AJ5]EMA31119.1 hypothetical protein C445_15186 [Halobiforma lacisalsi AJ5]